MARPLCKAAIAWVVVWFGLVYEGSSPAYLLANNNRITIIEFFALAENPSLAVFEYTLYHTNAKFKGPLHIAAGPVVQSADAE